MSDFALARKNMVDCQIRTAGVIDPWILDAFETIPREQFVPEKLSDVAYTDENIDIGQGRFLLEPIVHSKLLQAAKITDEDIVLDIGVGAGYSSAILSSKVTTIVALENNKRQMDKASRLWDKYDLCNIALIESGLENGEPKHAPYSLIIINGAVAEVPQVILDQLDIGGRLLTITKKPHQNVGSATLFYKSENGTISSTALFDAGVPYLQGFEPKVEFQF
ncbi:MAG: protein-L-isoaspartate O-methyltransferase family protein [Alcanivorax sp.]